MPCYSYFFHIIIIYVHRVSYENWKEVEGACDFVSLNLIAIISEPGA